jgi:hypothetical protein
MVAVNHVMARGVVAHPMMRRAVMRPMMDRVVGGVVMGAGESRTGRHRKRCGDGERQSDKFQGRVLPVEPPPNHLEAPPLG